MGAPKADAAVWVALDRSSHSADAQIVLITSNHGANQWQSFSNWCPGDVIDTRVIPLGPVKAGGHSLVLDVPDAVFVGGQGNFPFSAYVQAQSRADPGRALRRFGRTGG